MAYLILDLTPYFEINDGEVDKRRSYILIFYEWKKFRNTRKPH